VNPDGGRPFSVRTTEPAAKPAKRASVKVGGNGDGDPLQGAADGIGSEAIAAASMARAEAEEIVASAERQAQRLLRDAEDHARRLREEAERSSHERAEHVEALIATLVRTGETLLRSFDRESPLAERIRALVRALEGSPDVVSSDVAIAERALRDLLAEGPRTPARRSPTAAEEGARVLARQLCISGLSREAVEAHLRETYGFVTEVEQAMQAAFGGSAAART